MLLRYAEGHSLRFCFDDHEPQPEAERGMHGAAYLPTSLIAVERYRRGAALTAQ